MFRSQLPFALLVILFLIGLRVPAGELVLENSLVRYELRADGRNVALSGQVDKQNLLAEGATSPVCTLQKNGHTWESLSLIERDGLWHMTFGDAQVEVVIRPMAHDTHFTFEVVSVTGEGVDQLNFLYLPLGHEGRMGPLACTSLALNLQTNVPELPGPMVLPQATCYRRFGLVGARAALVIAPKEAMRVTLQRVLEQEDLPRSSLGGPWALDAEINRGSYLIDTEGEVGEDSVGEWIQLANNLGMKQVDLHTGKSMRFGDLAPNPARYPNGAEGVRAVVDQLHAAGLVAGLHTYAFFIAKDTPWVTPVPDRRLAIDASFTLGMDIDAAATIVPVDEPTSGISTVTGFQIRNSVTLRIDDELIVFSGVGGDANFGFGGCQRGAWGTTPTAHTKGSEVVQLKECFGLFVPDGDSTLFTEVAARTAEVYNAGGFDMIYLDALDGSDILAGGENAWHYAAKFVNALNARLDRPALFEMSTMTHHLWMMRSRMGAWDVPARGMQRVVEIHALANEAAARVYMPANLGWSGIFDWSPVQPERTTVDDVTYLCARALATDSSLSMLVGFTPASWERSANVRRLGGIVRRYEDLRLSRGLPEHTLAALRTLNSPFEVREDGHGHKQALSITHFKHRVTGVDTSRWKVQNPFASQTPRIRIEVLSGLEAPNASAALALTDESTLTGFEAIPTPQGLRAQAEVGPAAPGASAPSIHLEATNSGAPRHSAWGGISRKFAAPINLHGRGLGCWVHADGKGAVLNVQLQSTEAAAGGRAEHYIDLDFEGWKYFEIVEPESVRRGEFGWPYSRRHADWGDEVPFLDVLRDFILWVDYGQIDRLSLWINNVPRGETVACLVGPIVALPVQTYTATDATLEVNGTPLVIPGELRSGDMVEIDEAGNAILYDAKGEQVREFSVALPSLSADENSLALIAQDVRARVSLTVSGTAIAE